MFCTGHTDVFLQGLRVMYPINAAAVIIEERMHMTGSEFEQISVKIQWILLENSKISEKFNIF